MNFHRNYAQVTYLNFNVPKKKTLSEELKSWNVLLKQTFWYNLGCPWYSFSTVISETIIFVLKEFIDIKQACIYYIYFMKWMQHSNKSYKRHIHIKSWTFCKITHCQTNSMRLGSHTLFNLVIHYRWQLEILMTKQ